MLDKHFTVELAASSGQPNFYTVRKSPVFFFFLLRDFTYPKAVWTQL